MKALLYIYIRLVVVQVACVLMLYVLPVKVLVNDVWLCRMGHVLQCFLLHGCMVTRCCVTWVGCVRPHQYRSEVFWPAVCNDWWCWEGRFKSRGDVKNLLSVVGDVID